MRVKSFPFRVQNSDEECWVKWLRNSKHIHCLATTEKLKRAPQFTSTMRKVRKKVEIIITSSGPVLENGMVNWNDLRYNEENTARDYSYRINNQIYEASNTGSVLNRLTPTWKYLVCRSQNQPISSILQTDSQNEYNVLTKHQQRWKLNNAEMGKTTTPMSTYPQNKVPTLSQSNRQATYCYIDSSE